VWFDPCLDNSHVVNAVDIAIVDLLEQNQQVCARWQGLLLTVFLFISATAAAAEAATAGDTL